MGIEGTINDGLIVANIDDVIMGPGGIWRVALVDEVTSIPVLVSMIDELSGKSSTLSSDVLDDGLRHYPAAITSRLFLSTATEPYTITLDATFQVRGADASHLRLFYGTDTSSKGKAISHSLDTNGKILSDLVDLQPLDPNNLAIKRPGAMYTTFNMQDGDTCTAVSYSADGRIHDERRLVVINAGSIAPFDTNGVYLEDISIESPLLSATDPLVIENPVNHTFDTALITAKLHYSNGDVIHHPIDGNKAILFGLSNFDSGRVGKPVELMISYYPGPSEPAINLKGVLRPNLSKTYTLSNVATEGDYSLKVYAIPYRVADKWAVRWILTDAAYGVALDVSAHTTVLNDTNRAFNFDNDGVLQRMLVTVNVGEANSIKYPGHIHTQKLDISFPSFSTIDHSSWVMDYGIDGNTVFGKDLYATVNQTGEKGYKVDCNLPDMNTWLDTLYRGVDPVYDPASYGTAPVPTHVRVEHGGPDGRKVIGEFPVDEWDLVHYMGSSGTWEDTMSMSLVWLVKTVDTTLTLAMSPLQIKYLLV